MYAGIDDQRLETYEGTEIFLFNDRIFMLIYGMTGRNLGFFASYLTVMTAMFTISTISYDEHNHGILYLFTFPISRKMYVPEKYLFCMITTVAAAGGTFLMSMGIRLIRNSEVTMEELLISIIVAIALSILILCYMTPIQLKFGSEKSRVALLAVMAVLLVLLTVSFSLSERILEHKEF